MEKTALLLLVMSTIGLASCEHGYFVIEQAQQAARDERDEARDKEIDARFDRLDKQLGIPAPDEEENSSEPTDSAREPTQFVRDYYSNINNGQLDKSWDMLTPQFQAQKPSSYTQFTDWWNSVDQVQVKETNLISQNDETAVVEVKLSYLIGDRYKEERPLHLTLVRDDVSQDWKIGASKKL